MTVSVWLPQSVRGTQRVTLYVKGILLLQSTRNKAKTINQFYKRKICLEVPHLPKFVWFSKYMELPGWFPFFQTRQILDLDGSICSLQIFRVTLLVIRDLKPITQEEAPWRLPSEHWGLACQRVHVTNRRLAKVINCPALSRTCLYLPTAWEHLCGGRMGGAQVNGTTHKALLMRKVL